GGGDAVHAGHLDVQDGDVGAGAARGLRHLVAGADLGDDLEIALEPEQGCHGPAYECLVVGEQHGRHDRSTLILVPGPVPPAMPSSNSMRPPAWPTRSRSPVSPVPSLR